MNQLYGRPTVTCERAQGKGEDEEREVIGYPLPGNGLDRGLVLLSLLPPPFAMGDDLRQDIYVLLGFELSSKDYSRRGWEILGISG